MATNQVVSNERISACIGFDVSNTIVYNQSDTKLRRADIATLECPKCTKILRDPVQLITCGCRFCTVCIDSILATESSQKKCPVDLTVFNKKHIRKDKGCVKEINLLRVDCALGCGWRGLLVEAEAHLQLHCPHTVLSCDAGCEATFLRSEKDQHLATCPKQLVLCPHCNESVIRDELEAHYQSVCQDYPIVCDFCHIKLSRRAEFQQHLDDVCAEYEMNCPFQGLAGCKFKGKKKKMLVHVQEHTLMVLEKVATMWEKIETLNTDKQELQQLILQKDEELEAKNKQIEERDDMITKLDSRLRSLEMLVRHGHQLPDFVETDGIMDNASGKIKSKGASAVRSFGQRVAVDGGPSASSRQLGNLKESSESNKIQIRQLSQSVQMLQENMTQQTIVVDELRLRQDILDVRTTNGSFVWKIPDIRRRYREAIDRRTVSIYSPPYFTSPQGYRMCTRVYLNGDGIGKGTHISVFFVLMRSEHDSLLQWPFKQSVRFTLINQTNQSASITEAFAPDLSSPSFQQPENEMNIASGFPKFAKQSVLQDENFTKGNTIYIKAQVLGSCLN